MRKLTVAVLGFRIAYGLALVAAPARMTQRWLGRAGERGPTQVGVRGLGMRDALVHAGALRAQLRGEPAQPWLVASIAGDVTDIAATAAASGEVPEKAPLLTALVAGGSALVTAALLRAVSA